MGHTENNAREFEEFNKLQQEETMKLREDLLHAISAAVGLMT